MAINCSACNDLRETAPEFVQNGVTDTVCTSLKNDTGFNPSNDRTDCDDLNDANDCLIGNMEDEIEAYDICDWKTFMKTLIPNIYNVIKAIICAICGLWCNFHALISALQNTASFTPTQKYLRSSDAGSASYWHDCTTGGTIEFDTGEINSQYPNGEHNTVNHGTFYAPEDGVAIVSYCFAIQDNDNNARIGFHVTGYDSGESVSDETRIKRANHIGTLVRQGTWGQTTAVKMTKGHYLKLDVTPVYNTNPSTASYRLHQVCITFIPTFQLDIDASTTGTC